MTLGTDFSISTSHSCKCTHFLGLYKIKKDDDDDSDDCTCGGDGIDDGDDGIYIY